MIYLNLLLGFLKVGCFSFGGAYCAIPIIRDVVTHYGWIDDDTLTYMIAVSESTPGPIMVNLATYIGKSQGGFWGAVLATTAVVLPAFVIILLISAILKNLLSNDYFKAIIGGIKPCVVGIILAVGIYMTFETLLCKSGAVYSIDIKAVIITALCAFLMFALKPIFKLKKKFSPIALIIVAAVAGMIFYGV